MLAWRELEHGLAVVNTGAATATFIAPAGFAKLAGAQDPGHDDGAAVTGTAASCMKSGSRKPASDDIYAAEWPFDASRAFAMSL